MILKCMRDCVEFLEKEDELVKIEVELDPDLEMAEVHNRVFEAGGKAILFKKVKGSPFPAVSNLFGTYSRALKILEPELSKVSTLVNLTSNPSTALKSPIMSLKSLSSLIHALPLKKSLSSIKKRGTVLDCQCKISDIPMIRCWSKDGGAFILLPQVFSMEPKARKHCQQMDINGKFYSRSIETSPKYSDILASNLGMYRIQLSGGEYLSDREVGLHYQIHRGIANHHAKALEQNQPLPVSIFVGGPPAHTLAAIMPLPEGMAEVAFAGALAGRSFRYGVLSGRNSGGSRESGYGSNVISLDADFCIIGRVVPAKTKPEGPFGDHIGYYSLAHQFPYIEVDAVYHRKDAIWPFTVVGRPPREDSVFGKIIHEITASAIPHKLPGVTAIHAVDVAGVHPLLLAKAIDRYAPFDEQKPRELLTHANAILGTGQLSLAKYLIICSHNDKPELDISDEMGFFIHALERIDFTRDIHFQTCTTMDTLDYSAEGINEGSKVVMVASGAKRRELLRYFPSQIYLPNPFSEPRLAAPGIVVVKGRKFESYANAEKEISTLAIDLNNQINLEKSKSQNSLKKRGTIGNLNKIARLESLPFFVVVDDSVEASEDFSTFLWITFSRSNPSHDIYGAGSFTSFKHWGCTGPLIIDARIKPFHAPPLTPDPEVVRKIDNLARRGGPLYGIF
ncbi:MAG: UbiD family decarboxylase [Desulfamplus sp.]|nr:UbiD family decarboxylase [Desulfamplus sp.]